MAIKLHRCKYEWLKIGAHPCWRVEKALIDQGIEFERVPGPWPSRKGRTAVIEGTGGSAFPAIEFEDGTWYREQSNDMAARIREGHLLDR